MSNKRNNNFWLAQTQFSFLVVHQCFGSFKQHAADAHRAAFNGLCNCTELLQLCLMSLQQHKRNSNQRRLRKFNFRPTETKQDNLVIIIESILI